MYENHDRVTTAGLEMNASFDLGSYLDWPLRFEPYLKATYYTQRKDRSQTDDLLSFIPRSVIAYGVDLDYPDWGLFVNLNATYTGDRQQAAGSRYYLRSYTVVDLTVEKVLAEFADKNKISAKFAAQNIFDKDYEITRYYLTPGASVYFGLKYEYN
jgi:outer membrane cobalamin receptor